MLEYYVSYEDSQRYREKKEEKNNNGGRGR